MRVFGSTCWVVLHKSHVDGKFGDKAAKGIFVGYPDGSKAYKVILDNGKVVKARRVIFSENNSSQVADVPEDSPVDEVVKGETGLDAGSDDQDVDVEDDGGDDQQDDGSDKSADDKQGSAGSQDTLCRRGRSRRPPAEYWRPVSLVSHEAPMTYGQEVQGQESTKWRAAMDQEMDSIRKNKTWRLTDRPVGRRVLKGKWIYKVKDELDKVGNNTTRHKARLCFMGNRQIKGFDFNETFAPVAKFTTIRCILVMMSGYGKEHWAAVKRVFRYVKGSVDKGLVYNKSASGILQGFSDADWAGDYETRRSTTGFMFIFGGVAVSWASKMQKTVALSTMEAEYMALCEASKEAVWLDKLIQRVTMLATQSDNLVGPVNIKVDNNGCIAFAKIPVEHKRSKHIDIRFHFVRDAITTDRVILEHCLTDEMAADPMAKELAKVKHDKHVKTMGMR